MNIDLSTMNLSGLVAFVVFCIAFIIAFTLLIKSKPKIKGSRGSIEIGEALQKENTVKVEVSPHKTEVVTLRQLTMARHEIEGLVEYLYDVIIEDKNYNDIEKLLAKTRCELFGSKLLFGISRCYALNNIGKTLEEIEDYAERTARELNYLFEIFPDEYNLKHKLDSSWFKKVLFTIIRDGKGL